MGPPGTPDSEEPAGGVDPGRSADRPGPGQERGDGLEPLARLHTVHTCVLGVEHGHPPGAHAAEHHQQHGAG